MSLKIAMIGAGSIGFTRRLIADILTVPELGSTHFSLMDINEHNLSMVHQLVERDIQANGVPATVTATTDRREARGRTRWGPRSAGRAHGEPPALDRPVVRPERCPHR